MRSVSGNTVDEPAVMMSPVTEDGSTSGSGTLLWIVASVGAAGGEVGCAGALVGVAVPQAARTSEASRRIGRVERRTVDMRLSSRFVWIQVKTINLLLRGGHERIKAPYSDLPRRGTGQVDNRRRERLRAG